MHERRSRGHRSAIGSLLLVLTVAVGVALIGSRLAPQPTSIPTTTGLWDPGNAIAFRAHIYSGGLDVPSFKWRAGVDSAFVGTGWAVGEVRRERLDRGELIDVYQGEGESPTTTGRERVEITITPDGFRERTVLGPEVVETVDQPVDAVIAGQSGWYATIEAPEVAQRYTVSALVPVRPGSPGGLTEARLRAAGTAYRADLLATYTALPEGALGPASTQLLEAVRAAIPSGRDPDNPYDLARTMETYIRDPDHFAYVVDVRAATSQRCGDVSIVECYAIIREGYCLHSASTMAVLLRASGVPTRVAYGFGPGDRDADGNEVVSAARAHWWVEVYFPESGWVEFDPDGGNGEARLLPAGSA